MIIWLNLHCGEKYRHTTHVTKTRRSHKNTDISSQCIVGQDTRNLHKWLIYTHTPFKEPIHMYTHLFSFQQLSQEIHLVSLVTLPALGFTVPLSGTINAAPLSRNPANLKNLAVCQIKKATNKGICRTHLFLLFI